MKPLLILPLLLGACAVSQDQQGGVYEISSHSVTIRGIYDALDGQSAKPTEAMRAQAEAVCPGAAYLSANPYPHDNWTFLYLFQCPQT